MKKFVLAAILIVPMLWAGITWLISNETEQIFDDMLTESNQKFSKEFPFIKAEKQSFDKGFGTSTAISTVTLNSEIFSNEEPLSVNLKHVFYHGPVMLTPNGIKTGSSYILTTLAQESLSPEIKEIVSLVFDGKEPIISGIQTGIGSDIDVDLEIAPLVFDSKVLDAKSGTSSKDYIKLTMDATSSQFSTNSEATRLNGLLHLGAMNVAGKDSNGDINMSMLASVVEMNIDEIYKGAMLEGSVEMKIPEFSFSKNKGTDISLKGLKIISSAEQQNGNFGGLATVDVEKLLVEAADAPVKFPESLLHMSFGIKGMEQDSVKKLLDSSEEMRQSQLMLVGNKKPKKTMDAMNNSMTDYFKALGETLKQGVETNNIIEISNEKGKSAIKLDLTYTEAKKLFDLKTLREVITALKGQLKINIDKGMIAGTPLEQAINMPLSMGFVVEKGEAYEALADLGNGELLVNGKAMPIFDQMGPMADQPLPWDSMFGVKQ